MATKKSAKMRELVEHTEKLWDILEGMSKDELESLEQEVEALNERNCWFAAFKAKPLWLSVISCFK